MTYRWFTVGLLGAALCCGQKLPAKSDLPHGEQKTVEGLVRDIACPIQNKESTATKFSLKCAEECAKLGSPLAILVEDGTMYLPISNQMPDKSQRERLMPFVGKYVIASGQVYERGGMHAIVISEIKVNRNKQIQADAFQK